MALSAYRRLFSSGTGSVKVRLNAISSGQLTLEFPVTPWPFMRETRSTVSAPETSTFVGSQPRSAQVPPNGRKSMTATPASSANSHGDSHRRSSGSDDNQIVGTCHQHRLLDIFDVNPRSTTVASHPSRTFGQRVSGPRPLSNKGTIGQPDPTPSSVREWRELLSGSVRPLPRPQPAPRSNGWCQLQRPA